MSLLYPIFISRTALITMQTLRNIRCLLILLLSAAMVGCEDDDNDHDFGSNDPNVYVAMGDSITSGLGYSSVEPYPAKLSAMLGKTVINKGHGGDLSSDGRTDVNSILATYKPGYLLILYGANDIIYGYGADHIIANLRAIIQAAKTNKTIPVIATLTPAFGSHAYMAGGINDLNAGIREMAAEEGVSVADMDSAFGGNSNYMLSDGLHPNDKGAELIATTFSNVL